MTRKRDTQPETLLATVIRALERGDYQSGREAVRSLLAHGPLLAFETLSKELKREPPFPSEEVSRTVDELLAFLRSIVGTQGQRLSHGISLNEVTFTATTSAVAGPSRATRVSSFQTRHHVVCVASGSTRDLAVLQFVLLIRMVGLGNVQVCAAAPECPRLFVKTYRREFCSVTCQKRVQKRKLRQQERERRERLARKRERRKGA